MSEMREKEQSSKILPRISAKEKKDGELIFESPCRLRKEEADGICIVLID